MKNAEECKLAECYYCEDGYHVECFVKAGGELDKDRLCCRVCIN